MNRRVAVLNGYCAAVAVSGGVVDNSASAVSQQGLVQLPDGHSVVVTYTGDHKVAGVPWSMLLPEWAHSMPEVLDTLDDYKESLISWLASRKDLFSPDRQVKAICVTYRALVVELLDDATAAGFLARIMHGDQASSAFTPMTDREYSSVIHQSIRKSIGEYARATPYESVDADADNEFVMEHVRIWDGILEEELAQRDLRLGKATRRSVTEFLPLLCVQRAQNPTPQTELCIIGYGARQPFPGIVRIAAEVILGQSVRYLETGRFGVEPQHSQACVLTVGDGDGPIGFLKGVEHDFVTRLVNHYEALRESGNRALPDDVIDSINMVFRDIEDISQEHYVNPMLASISASPPEEVARIAQALLNTLVLRAAAEGEESALVGGRISVLVLRPHSPAQWLAAPELT